MLHSVFHEIKLLFIKYRKTFKKKKLNKYKFYLLLKKYILVNIYINV